MLLKCVVYIQIETVLYANSSKICKLINKTKELDLDPADGGHNINLQKHPQPIK